MKHLLPLCLFALAVPVAHAQTLFDPTNSEVIQNLNTIGDEASARELQPTTLPIVAYTDHQRLAHVSGVLLANGHPVPNALVNVTADLGDGFVSGQQVRTDTRGVYNIWFQAPAPIQSVLADSPVVLVSNTERAGMLSQLFPGDAQ